MPCRCSCKCRALSRAVESLVEPGTFGSGSRAEKTLWLARWALFWIYTLFLVILLSSLLTFLLGRVETVDHRVKYEALEAPSVAACPWEPGTEIVIPNTANASHILWAEKFKLDGSRVLYHKPRRCEFDRVCQCLDLFDVELRDTESEGHTGILGVKSKEEMGFRERIEIHTTLSDSSPWHTFKFGLYDSRDLRPSWFYAPQWCYMMGQLRLDSWLLSEAPDERDFRSVSSAVKSVLSRWRHFYIYTYSDSQNPPNITDMGHRLTTFSYEYRSFFVVETISSQRSRSLYGIVSFVVLLVAASNLLMVWEYLFPIDHGDELVRRTVAKPVRYLAMKLFGLDLGGEADAPVEARLSKAGAPPESPGDAGRRPTQAYGAV